MNKEGFKKKSIVIIILAVFLGVFALIFGMENLPVGLMILLVTAFTLGSDLSFKPKTSFVKILITLWILALVAYYNSYQTTILGIVLNFLVIFGVTYTSFHFFNENSYLGYLLGYFIMFCSPIESSILPMRLIALFFGAIFIVGVNILVNRKKQYKTSRGVLENLLIEIDNAIDLKIEGHEVDQSNFEITNKFYLSIFDNLSYKLFATQRQEQVLNIAKSLQYIGILLSKADFTNDELIYLKGLIEKLSKNENIDIDFKGIKTREMHYALLNLKVIQKEIDKEEDIREFDKEELKLSDDISSSIREFIRFSFSRHSIKFNFAFKMAAIMAIWQIVGFAFNLPYIKWLYFTSLTALLPYTNDLLDKFKSRIKATAVATVVFFIAITAIQYANFVPKGILMAAALMVVIYLMMIKISDEFYKNLFTAILSIATSLMYIPLEMALPLKFLWTLVALAVCGIFSFWIMPYSIEKESRVNLRLYSEVNNRIIKLIRQKALGNKINKTSLIIGANLISDNIEGNDNIHSKQIEVNEIANAILNYMELIELPDTTNEKIVKVIDGEELNIEESDLAEKTLLSSIKHIVELNGGLD